MTPALADRAPEWSPYRSRAIIRPVKPFFRKIKKEEGGLPDDGSPKGSDDEEKAMSLVPPEETAGAAPLEAVLEPSPLAGPEEEADRRARLAEDRLAQVLVAYRRLKAEEESYRQRTTRTLQRNFEQRHEALLLKFIDVMDNLDRALEAAQSSYASPSLVEGLILVRTQVLQILQDAGLERIPVLGLPYDPHLSEAMGTEPVGEPEHHHVVVRELLRGYSLKGRVARPSRVVVGEFVPENKPHSEPNAVETDPPIPPEDGPSLEEIIARVESQEALFPEVFPEPSGDEDTIRPRDAPEVGAPPALPEKNREAK